MKLRVVSSLRRREVLKAAGAAAAVGMLPVSTPFAAAQGARMKIGIVGSGNIGSAVGRAWAMAGHEVMFSSRHLEDDRKLAAEVGKNARAGSTREAAAFGDVVLLAVPYRAMPEIGQTLGDVLKGKVVIDACNPRPERDGEIATRALEKGAGLMSAELLPGARIVRAFNTIGSARILPQREQPGRIGMPIAGDDRKAIEIASGLIREVGFEPILIGGLPMGRHLTVGTPLVGEHTPDEIRKIVATLKP